MRLGARPAGERLVQRPIAPAASPEPRLRARPAGRASLRANESAAAGCAATTFPVFVLNSAGGGRSAPSPRLSGNTPPHAPLGPPRARPLLDAPYKTTPRRRSPPRPPASFPAASGPAAPPTRRRIPPRSPAPLAWKPSRRGAGPGAGDCGAAVGPREGSGGKPGVERPRGSGGTWRARAAAHLPRADPELLRSRRPCRGLPESQSLIVSAAGSYRGYFAGDPTGCTNKVM